MDNLTIEYGPTTGNNHVDQGPWALAVDYLVSAMSSNMGGTAFSAGREMSSVEDGSIAVISIDGVMSRGGSFWGGTSTASVVQQVHAAMGNPRIKGIVLSINSPGGYSAGTKELADAVSQAKAEKPVYASISDVGASAAYWVASQATKVFAAPDAIVGSIGTYTVLPDIHRMAENAGVTIHVIRAESSGEHKAAGVPGAPVSATQLAEIRRIVTAKNEFFLQGVQDGRGMTRETLLQVADGRVFMAAESVGLGLVDEVASLGQVISQLVGATSPADLKGSSKMSDSINTETVAGVEITTPVAAAAAPPAAPTIKERVVELRAACPDATDSQVLQWLESEATVVQAQSAHVAALVAQVHELSAAVAANKSATVNSKGSLASAVVGINPIGNQSAPANITIGSAEREWKSKVNEYVALGMSKKEAVSRVRSENQELTVAYVAESNGKI